VTGRWCFRWVTGRWCFRWVTKLDLGRIVALIQQDSHQSPIIPDVDERPHLSDVITAHMYAVAWL